MGAEFDANITVDKGGFALADHGVSASLRDFGRFGLLMLNDGKSFGNQVIPSAVVNDILNQKGDPTWSLPSRPGYKPFYRSFWWGEGNPRGDIGGKGIHGQTLRVVPKADMVIVMYSSWPRAEANGDLVGWLQADELVDSLVAKFR
jgi:CubicO group peptidase (beta-lactamase class C family)